MTTNLSPLPCSHDEDSEVSSESEPCFFTHPLLHPLPAAHGDVNLMDGVFTCGIRPQHRGKPFSQVRDEDPGLVEWVLSIKDFRSKNLGAFAAFCRS